MTTAGPFARIPDWLAALRVPEYTGSNRCVPCTVVNLTIAVLLAAALATLSRPVAAGALLFMIGLIYLRGYLVPGTPTWTKRYLPGWVLAAFGHDELATGEDGFDPETLLLESGVIVEDASGVDFELDPAFEADWTDRYDALAAGTADRARLAALVSIDADRLDVERHGNAFVAWLDDSWIGQWESRVAFLADVAADEILPEYVSGWATMPLARRSNTLGVLRLFIERCPACQGVIALEATVTESCCREVDVIATTCRGCGERLFEAVYEPEAMQAAHEGLDAGETV